MLSITPTSRRPWKARSRLPSPPERLTPPSSTAVMTNSGVLVPICQEAMFYFAESSTPPRPESRPVSMKAAMRTESTLMLAYRLAVRFPPVA